jgi:hypothetical protein
MVWRRRSRFQNAHAGAGRIQTMDNKLFQTTMLFKKEEDRLLDLKSQFFGDLCLSYIVT